MTFILLHMILDSTFSALHWSAQLASIFVLYIDFTIHLFGYEGI
jgi:hypothetical protein